MRFVRFASRTSSRKLRASWKVGTGAILWALILLVLAPTPQALAQTPNRAGIVVNYGGGRVEAQCVSFTEASISGYELLNKSSFGLIPQTFPGKGEAVCRISDVGCSYPQRSCFCQCESATCVYWSYWQQANGDWIYSGTGSSTTTVQNGSVDGWSWSAGSSTRAPTASRRCIPSIKFAIRRRRPPSRRPPPPYLAQDTSFATPTATATRQSADSTATPTPTVTWTPTPGPTPTETPTPIATPSILRFDADRTQIAFGESVTLNWDVAGAATVLLRYPGAEESLPAQGSKVVTPQQSTTYTLFSASVAGANEAAVTVDVAAVFSAPTAAPAEAAQPGAVVETPSAMPVEAPAETPTETWTPPPTEMPTETPAPSATPLPPVAEVAPPVITVVVTSDAGAVSPLATPQPQPAVVLLEPGAAIPASAGGAQPDTVDEGRTRLFLTSGIALVFGLPLLFGGIWFVIWSIWRRR